jgi:glycosyltransferase involved in cell wall biosynthesis
VNGPDLKREFIPPLRRKCVEVVMSTLAADDFNDPVPCESGAVKLLTVSRLVRNKRIDVVMRATRILLDRGVDAQLTLLGEGPLQDDLLRLADEIQLRDRFQFVGLVDDPETLRRYYADASLFVLSSETEGISLAVQEAMAAGTPVVVTAPGGMGSFLAPGEDSIVVPEPDPVAFADAIQSLLGSPDTYLRIARAAQEKVSRISNRRWAQQLERTIRRDLAGGIQSRSSPARD